MKFQPGQSGNPFGRPPGAKDKVNQILRENITDFLSGSFEKIQLDFNVLKPYQRIKFWIELLNYSVPKLSTLSTTDDFERMTEDQLNEIINQLKNSHEHETREN